MINLIPNEEKKQKVKDFYFRLFTTFVAILSFSILISAASILPAYFLSSVKKNLVNNKLEAQKNEPLPAIDSTTLSVMQDLNDKLNLAEKNRKGNYLVSQKIIQEIVSEKMPDIKITQILYQNDPGKGKTVSINGTASSRERLLIFRQNLEENLAFKKVDLPVSNFVKGSNIRFYLNLIPS